MLLASCHLLKGEYEQSSLVWAKANRDVMPAFCGSHWAWALFALGRTEEGNSMIQESLEKNPNDAPGEFTAMKALLLAAAGDGESLCVKVQNVLTGSTVSLRSAPVAPSR